MNNDTIGQNLKRIIKEKETTMTKVANKCGVSLQAIRLVAIDENKPSKELLGRICKALGVYQHHILGSNKLGRNASRGSSTEGEELMTRTNTDLNKAESGHVSLTTMIKVSGKQMESQIFYKRHIANWNKADRVAFQNWIELIKSNN